MVQADVFVIPDDWTFYQADLSYGTGHCTVAAEPVGSVSSATITIDLQTKLGNATLFLDADEASEIWTALGHAIKNASGNDPVAKELIPT